jgi:hypothetical protein
VITRNIRILISTPMPESMVAPYLTELAARVEPRGVKVGSYPRWGKKRNTVTLVGRYVHQSDETIQNAMFVPFEPSETISAIWGYSRLATSQIYAE